MRVPDRDPQALAGQAAGAAEHCPARPGHRDAAHLGRDVPVFLEPDPAEPAAGRDGEGGPGDQATLGQVPGEDTDAVAAHLGGAPVVVAVVHEPLGCGAGLGAWAAAVRCRGGLAPAPGPGARPGQRLGPHRAQHPVGADAGPAVTQPRGQVRRKPLVARWINQNDEVILGAVPLREPHSQMLAVPGVPRPPSAAVGNNGPEPIRRCGRSGDATGEALASSLAQAAPGVLAGATGSGQARGQVAKRCRSSAVSCGLSPKAVNRRSFSSSSRRPASAKSWSVRPGSSRRANPISWAGL